MATSSASAPPTSTTSTVPASSSPASDGGNSSPTSKPLLFFVALGFGVVFTNLWIIVGVKYCFRYNRSRRAGPTDENGEPIGMANMPRPRRKREKKLMTMDEVNERFPLTKYKIWRSGREQDGLPAAGGITAPPSRAVSIHEQNELRRVSTELSHEADDDHAKRSSDEHSHHRCDSGLDGTHEGRPTIETARPSTSDKDPRVEMIDHKDESASTPVTPTTATRPDNAEEEDDPIQQAGVPAEYASKPGDTCAICIDTLEDEDDVRGLTCGHAFHAGCLDPWLTSRRACCPLCKADFYVPKPRNPDADVTAAPANDRNMPQPPEPARVGRVGNLDYLVNLPYRLAFPTLISDRSTRPARPSRSHTQQPESTGQTDENTPPRPSRLSRLRSSLPTPRIPFRRTQTTDVSGGAPSSTTTTPSQLEAGSR
ncbi:MAG: hypothetical protein Q9162_000773 [Coniocarpon cinnabarinum]